MIGLSFSTSLFGKEARALLTNHRTCQCKKTKSAQITCDTELKSIYLDVFERRINSSIQLCNVWFCTPAQRNFYYLIRSSHIALSNQSLECFARINASALLLPHPHPHHLLTKSLFNLTLTDSLRTDIMFRKSSNVKAPSPSGENVSQILRLKGFSCTKYGPKTKLSDIFF